jgi:hypothetical protein
MPAGTGRERRADQAEGTLSSKTAFRITKNFSLSETLIPETTGLEA